MITDSGNRNRITEKILVISELGKSTCSSNGVPGTGTSMFIVTSSGYILANSNVISILWSLVSPNPIIPPVHNSKPASLAISSVSNLSW